MYQHEALPGALAQFVGAISRVPAIKTLRRDYGFEGLKEPIEYTKAVIPAFHTRPIHPEVILRDDDNPDQETIENLQDAQRQLLDALDNLKQITRDIDNRDAGNSLRYYIIPALECAITEDHDYLDSSANLDSVIRDLEEQDNE